METVDLFQYRAPFEFLGGNGFHHHQNLMIRKTVCNYPTRCCPKRKLSTFNLHVSFNIHHFHYVNWLQKLPLIRSDETFVDLSRGTVIVLPAAAADELCTVVVPNDDDTVAAPINWLQKQLRTTMWTITNRELSVFIVFTHPIMGMEFSSLSRIHF